MRLVCSLNLQHVNRDQSRSVENSVQLEFTTRKKLCTIVVWARPIKSRYWLCWKLYLWGIWATQSWSSFFTKDDRIFNLDFAPVWWEYGSYPASENPLRPPLHQHQMEAILKAVQNHCPYMSIKCFLCKRCLELYCGVHIMIIRTIKDEVIPTPP